MSSLVITMQLERSQEILQQLYELPNDSYKEESQALQTLLRCLSGGQQSGKLWVQSSDDDPTQAGQSIVVSQAAGTVGDILTLAGVNFTVVSGTPAQNQFNLGANNAAMAANIIAAINASLDAKKVISAVVGATTATVIVTANQPGAQGNSLGISATVDSGTPFAFTGSTFTGGAGGAQDVGGVYNLGLA